MQRGLIRKHHGAWHLVFWDVEYKNGVKVRRQKSVKLAPINEEYQKESDVRLIADKHLEPINRKQVQPESAMLVSEFIENHYLPHVKAELRPSTYKDYKKDIYEKHLVSRLGKVRLRDFRTVHGQRLLRQIPGVGHKTLLRIKSFLSGTFKHAKREGFLDGINPMQDVSAPGRPKKFVGKAYTLEQINQMLPMMPDLMTRTIIFTAAMTGLRLSELRGLRWTDYDGETLHVSRSVWRIHVSEPKNVASENYVPVIPSLKFALDEHRKVHASDTYIFQGAKRPVPLNLPNLANRIIKPSLRICSVCGVSAFKHEAEADHIFKVDAEKSVPWLGWHSFRRGLASNLYSLGIQPKIIQEILRHSDVHTTIQIYVKTSTAESREAMEKVEERRAELLKMLTSFVDQKT